MCSKKLTCPVKPGALSLSQEKPSWAFYHSASELGTNPSTSTCYGLRGFSSGIWHYSGAHMPPEFMWFEASVQKPPPPRRDCCKTVRKETYVSDMPHNLLLSNI